MAIVNTGTFKPVDWDNITSIPYDPSHSITGINNSYITNAMPGALLDYSFEHDKDWLQASGRSMDDLEAMFKKELAVKLAEKMIADGHIVFTKQDIMHNYTIRYKAYTWVGNKSLIEQERKRR